MFEKEEEDDDEDEEEEEDNISEGSEVPESDRPAGAQHHQINGERAPQNAKERVKEWSPCGPYQGQDEGRGPAPGSCTRQVFSMTAMSKEGGSGKDPLGVGRCRAGRPGTLAWRLTATCFCLPSLCYSCSRFAISCAFAPRKTSPTWV